MEKSDSKSSRSDPPEIAAEESVSKVTSGNNMEGKNHSVQSFSDANAIDFEDNDPADPLNWPRRRKLVILGLLVCLNITNQIATIIPAPVTPQILSGLHSSNVAYRTLLVSIWEGGEIIGPLVYGPFSELYGRTPVIHAANTIYLCLFVGAALSPNIQALVAFRFLTGAAAVGPTLSPAIVGDLYRKEERGSALSGMVLLQVMSPVIGPIIGSYLGEREGWRWTFWLPTILSGCTTVLLLLVYRETYRVKILGKKVQALRGETGNTDLHSKYNTGETAPQLFLNASIRPLKFLATAPMLTLMTLQVSVSLGLCYLALTNISPVFQETYDFSEGASGLAFIGLAVGFITGSITCRFTLDWLVKRQSRKGRMTPERRLPPLITTCFALPVGFFIFGWTAQKHVHWMAPEVGLAFIGLGQVATSIVTRSYIIDAFGIYGASAIAAMLVPMNIMAAFFPLAGPRLYAQLGLGWGNSVLGFIAVGFAPLPIVLILFGERIRRSKVLFIAE